MPKIESENKKKRFMLQGAKICNMMPPRIQDSQSAT